MNYFKGVIIEESLDNTSVLKDVYIISTKVQKVTKEHKTSHLQQWTLNTVEIPETNADLKSGAQNSQQGILVGARFRPR